MTLYVLSVLLGVLSGYNDPDSLIRGIYINPWKACRRDYMEGVYARADSGFINAIVVDLKSDYGYLCYDTDLELAKKIKAVKKYIDLDSLVARAQRHGIKVIARVVCYRDNYLAKYHKFGMMNSRGRIWKDNTGSSWVNPYVDSVNDYLVSVIKELDQHGIRSIALDYIRFPTDGNIKAIQLANVKGPRSKPIISLLKKIRKMAPGVEIGMCIYGYAVWYEITSIGQYIYTLSEYADVFYPMLYPSHFHPKFLKEVSEYWRNYWIYYDSVREAFVKVPLSVKVIPFVQGFDLFAEDYGHEYISAQMNGLLGSYADGFLIWNAASNYSTSWTPLRWARNLIQCRSVPNCLDTRMREILLLYRDTAPPASLSQAKNQTTIPTSPLTDTPTDSQPSRKIRKFSRPDQIPPW